MTPGREAEAHRDWDELAAGHVLHALEPDEEQRFTDHLGSCERCQRLVDEHAHVAAQLGALAHDDQADDVDAPPAWDSIRTGIVGTSPRRTDPVVVPLQQRRARTAARLLAAAAAVIVAGGVSVTLLRGGGSSPSPATVAMQECSSSPTCHVVRLQQDKTERAVVLVDGQSARVVPTAMSAAPSGDVYALWQMPRDGRPVLVSALPGMRQGQPTASASLSLPYADTAAFAISRDPASVIPTTPTEVLAVGVARA